MSDYGANFNTEDTDTDCCGSLFGGGEYDGMSPGQAMKAGKTGFKAAKFGYNMYNKTKNMNQRPGGPTNQPPPVLSQQPRPVPFDHPDDLGRNDDFGYTHVKQTQPPPMHDPYYATNQYGMNNAYFPPSPPPYRRYTEPRRPMGAMMNGGGGGGGYVANWVQASKYSHQRPTFHNNDYYNPYSMQDSMRRPYPYRANHRHRSYRY